MNTDIYKQTAAEYFKAVFASGLGGLNTLFKDMGEVKANTDDPKLWLGVQSCSLEAVDALDHFLSVAEDVGKEIAENGPPSSSR